jgi:signal transduction histidine kinase
MSDNHTPDKIILRAFPGIAPEEVSELISNSKSRNYPSGTTLCLENSIEDTFYIILDGEVEVSKVINNLEARKLKTLGPGDFFGEMALIHNAPRAATVISQTPIIVLEIDKLSFDKVLKHSSSVSLAMVREISNRLRQNDELAIDDLRIRASELAEAYQKLAEQELARREFLTTIAHELRTPLMSANGYVQLIQKGAVSDDSFNPVMNTISRNIQQITSLVNDILFIQEMDLIIPKFEPVDMLEIAIEISHRYQEKADRNQVTIEIKTGDELPKASGDTKQLERALTSLVDNAIKFSPDGGKVRIILQKVNEQILITVSDQGVGIPTDKLPLIFDRFYHRDSSDTSDNLFGGLGLGLAITRQVIKQHNGRMFVESTPGKGSTFKLSLNIWNDI